MTNRSTEARTGSSPAARAAALARTATGTVPSCLGEVRATISLLAGSRWWWRSAIVFLAMVVMAGLGFWQLDRLEQRRAFNAGRRAALAAPPVQLVGDALPGTPSELRDRVAVAHGQLDYARQVAVRNQSYQGQPGFHLVTPLRISGSDKGVLVNRGWIPPGKADPSQWRALDERQKFPLSGVLQPTRRRPDGTVSETPEDATAGWYRLDIEAIGRTLPYELVPVVLQLLPAEDYNPEQLPRRIEHDITFTEGNHFSYALQWFSFAAIAAIVYVSVARRSEADRSEGPNSE